jgi:hypothetical protein
MTARSKAVVTGVEYMSSLAGVVPRISASMTGVLHTRNVTNALA